MWGAVISVSLARSCLFVLLFTNDLNQELTWKKPTTRSATHRLTMNTCMGALYFLLLSSTHRTKLFPRVVRASTRPSTAISARARLRSLTRGWGSVWGVAVEPFSGEIPKKDPPLCELLMEFSPETNRDDRERLFLLAVTRDDRAIPSQSDSSPKLSIPGRQTVAVMPACCLFTLENMPRRKKTKQNTVIRSHKALHPQIIQIYARLVFSVVAMKFVSWVILHFFNVSYIKGTLIWSCLC